MPWGSVPSVEPLIRYFEWACGRSWFIVFIIILPCRHIYNFIKIHIRAYPDKSMFGSNLQLLRLHVTFQFFVSSVYICVYLLYYNRGLRLNMEVFENSMKRLIFWSRANGKFFFFFFLFVCFYFVYMFVTSSVSGLCSLHSLSKLSCSFSFILLYYKLWVDSCAVKMLWCASHFRELCS